MSPAHFQISLPNLWLALILGLVCLGSKHGAELVREREVYLSLSVSADRPTVAYPKFLDTRGQPQGDRILIITPGMDPHPVRVLMPHGDFQGIYMRFDGRESNVAIRRAYIRNTAGTLDREIPLSDVRSPSGLEIQRPAQGGVAVHLRASTSPHTLAIRVPVDVGAAPEGPWLPGGAALMSGLIGTVLSMLVTMLLTWRGYRTWREVWGLVLVSPRRAILLAGMGSALISMLPVLTAQRGFIGHFSGGYLVYEAEQSLPGQGNSILSPPPTGVDVAAIPYSALGQMRQAATHLWRDGELLLWDRFNRCGSTYIGQGMFLYLSPLLWPVLLLGGTISSWTWAFFLAKMIFPVGLGLYLRRIGISLPVCLAGVVASGFIGAFTYRTGHFAFFATAAFPVVMLGLDGLLEPRGGRLKRLAFLACWLAGCLACLFSGAPKEGAMLLMAANGLVLYQRLWSAGNWRKVRWYFIITTWATLVFVLLTAPGWMTFLPTMTSHVSLYHGDLYFHQKPVGAILSIFEEFFGRIFEKQYAQSCPNLNLLFLPGFFFAIAACVTRREGRDLLGPVLASMVLLCLAFGVISGKWILPVPFLGNTYTMYNAFGQAALPFLILASARGWDLWLGLAGGACPRWYRWAGFGFLGVGVTGLSILPLLRAAKLNFPLFLCVGLALVSMILMLPWLIHGLCTKRGGKWGRACMTLALVAICAVAIGRNIYSSHISLAPWLYVMPERVKGELASTAAEWVRREAEMEPARVIGVKQTFITGINTYYGLESISGPMPFWKATQHEIVESIPGLTQSQLWSFSLSPESVAMAAPFLEFLNCRYILAMPGQAYTHGAPRVTHSSDMEYANCRWHGHVRFSLTKLNSWKEGWKFTKGSPNGQGRSAPSPAPRRPSTRRWQHSWCHREVRPPVWFRLTTTT